MDGKMRGSFHSAPVICSFNTWGAICCVMAWLMESRELQPGLHPRISQSRLLTHNLWLASDIVMKVKIKSDCNKLLQAVTGMWLADIQTAAEGDTYHSAVHRQLFVTLHQDSNPVHCIVTSPAHDEYWLLAGVTNYQPLISAWWSVVID